AALLRLQSRRVTNEDARQALEEAKERVASIAVVHEILSQNFDEEVAFDEIADRILHRVGDVAASSGEVIARREGSFGMINA
ncbi:histidine kinase dimerization/phosphoacceptor domain -containing protein, partial [Klebsiella pneumoniae]